MHARAMGLIPVIPAMTTDAEREFYYRLVKESAHLGAVVELGAWLGASTAYIAAGMRDAGVKHKAQVYDRFISNQSHVAKVKAFYAERSMSGEMPDGDQFKLFKDNLGQLIEYVEPHQGEISQLKWNDGPIAVLISDAPKRVHQISSVLTTFKGALQQGSVMAWQDFCHFPSYEIPACLYRLGDRLEFTDAIVPGTTLAFMVVSQWGKDDVSPERFAISHWSVGEIYQAWDYWLSGPVPSPKAALFRCGAAMFLCDIGKPKEGVRALRSVFLEDADAILPKWRYLKKQRTGLVTRYQPLFDYLEGEGALCSAS